MQATGTGQGAGPPLLWGLLLIFLAAVLAVAVIKVRPLLRPELALLVPLDPACDLTVGPCTLRLPDGISLTLDVQPRGIPPVTPLTLNLSVQGMHASSAQVDFTGLDMNMGYNRATLTAVAPGQLQGHGMLPICVSGRMAWEARVLIDTPAGLVAAPFRFETARIR